MKEFIYKSPILAVFKPAFILGFIIGLLSWWWNADFEVTDENLFVASVLVILWTAVFISFFSIPVCYIYANKHNKGAGWWAFLGWMFGIVAVWFLRNAVEKESKTK